MPLYGADAIHRKLARLRNDLAVKAPKLIGAEAERFYKQSFANQGFTDATLRPWPKTKKGKPGRILKKTGLLMNSIRIERADLNMIRIVAGGPHVPYARIHNEGGTIEGSVSVRTHTRRASVANTRRGRILRKMATVKEHTRRMLVYMPKRQYIGKSAVLEARIRGTLIKLIGAALQSR